VPPLIVMNARVDTVGVALAWAREALAGVSDSEPLDAQVLLAHVLGCERVVLLTHPEQPLTGEQSARFRDLVNRRAAGTPIAYLTGSRAFYDLELVVTPDVLIPRPETEYLVEVALDWAQRRHPLRVVDVGTGSGAIAVALARQLPDARVWAVDVSVSALEVARRNAARYDLGERIEFVQGDLLAPLAGAAPFDLVVANLPYIAGDELAGLAVTRHEPRLALDGGPDGLDVIRRLLRQAPDRMAAESLLALEVGAGQGARVARLAQVAFPAARVRVLDDYAGHDRIVCVERGN